MYIVHFLVYNLVRRKMTTMPLFEMMFGLLYIANANNYKIPNKLIEQVRNKSISSFNYCMKRRW
jgi:hypothetical protein